MSAVLSNPVSPIHLIYPFIKMLVGTFLAFFGLGLRRPLVLAAAALAAVIQWGE